MKLKYFFILFFSIIFLQAKSQFYNGHQMTFGKNRVQYNNFYWSYYRYKRFDTYYYADGKQLANYIARFAEKEIIRIENFFGFALDKRVIFIIYNKQSDFKQSNIGLLSGNDAYNVGGTTAIINNKVFLYFDGSHENFRKQVSLAVTELLLKRIMDSSGIRDKMASSAALHLPDWYIQGLVRYVSYGWNIETENVVKDRILNGKYDKINHLTGEDAALAGHSIWQYIAKSYGEAVIPSILYLAKVNRNPETGFVHVLGIGMKELLPLWIDFYKAEYEADNKKRTAPDPQNILRKARHEEVYYQVKISPDGRYIAYASNETGLMKIWLYDSQSGKHKKIFQKGHRIETKMDYTYPILAWSPQGGILSYLLEVQGKLVLYSQFIKTEKIVSRNMQYFNKILDFSYSQQADKLVLSAVMNGKTDIYVFDMSSGTHEAITNDLADDFNPRFVSASSKIIFSSNRMSDTLSLDRKAKTAVSSNFDLFIYDYQTKSKILTRLTNTPYYSEYKPLEIAKNKYSFLSDKVGIISRESIRYDSTINYIDTATHYRYFSKRFLESQLSRNIFSYDINPRSGKLTEIVFNKGRYAIYESNVNKQQEQENKYLYTAFRKVLNTKQKERDSLLILKQKREAQKREERLKKPKKIINPDSLLIDVNNYIFEREKSDYQALIKKVQPTKLLSFKQDSSGIPKIQLYLTSFYPNTIVSQVDFGFLSSSYQAYTGNEVYFSPGFNVLFKLGVNDLFENYKVIGGVRFSGDFDSNEYLLSLENLKKRLDRQYIFHRRVFKEYAVAGNVIVKTTSQKLMHILSYPFSQVASLRGTVGMRYDKMVALATDRPTLESPNADKLWGNVKLEYIFDNSVSLGVNLYRGTRMKAWAEAYKQINGKKTDLFVLGVDARHYTRLHRNFIWANRFAASTSFGNSRLLYYLGGVDNWIRVDMNQPIFIPQEETPINNEAQYAYQAVATNLRGFPQNIRNGNSFMLINSELRFPIISYLANRPINSDFLRNLQLVGFYDIGTAWSGLTPWDKANAYNYEVLENGPLTVTIDKDRAPVVMGFGFGVRSRLLGYFIRADWAWGVEDYTIHPRIFYLSLSLDF